MDAFIIAFRIPNLVRDLFAEGAMSAAFVPTFTRTLTVHGRAAAWRLGSNVLTAVLLVTGVLVALGIVFAHPLVTLYAGDYASVPGKLDLTIRLTRIMLPFLTLVGVAAVCMGMLNSVHRFFVPALSPAMFNVVTIVFTIALVPAMRSLGLPGITSVALATLAGGAAQIAAQWPLLRREGFRYAPVLAPNDPALRDVLLLMGPGTLGLAATQINIFVNTLLATGQGTGAASWLNYAFRLMYFPIGLFGVSIGTAVLPAVSRHAADNDRAAIRATVSHGLSMMLMLNIPATLGIFVLARPIVELLFEHGRFMPSDTEATAAALRFYALGLIGYSAARIVSPTFYALRQSRIAVGASISAIILNVVLSVALVDALGFRGLALAASLAALINGVLLIVLLGRRLDGIDGGHLFTVAWKTTAAAAIMAAAAWGVHGLLVSHFPGANLGLRALRVGAAISTGVAVLAVAVKIVRIREFDDAISAVASRLRR